MIDHCSRYLREKIKAVMGGGAPYFTRFSDLAVCAESHVASAIVDSDVLVYNGKTARNVRTHSGDIRVYDRTVTINVVLGEYKTETLSPLFDQFVCSLDRSILRDGHEIRVDLGEAGWVADKDSLIRAKIAVEIPVIFHGGMYRPRKFAKLNDTKIKMEAESYDGSNRKK